eukprot:scaffold3607_cov114-Isochrysis_galbana.AAC.18
MSRKAHLRGPDHGLNGASQLLPMRQHRVRSPYWAMTAAESCPEESPRSLLNLQLDISMPYR